jgi:hypothetical protein
MSDNTTQSTNSNTITLRAQTWNKLHGACLASLTPEQDSQLTQELANREKLQGEFRALAALVEATGSQLPVMVQTTSETRLGTIVGSETSRGRYGYTRLVVQHGTDDQRTYDWKDATLLGMRPASLAELSSTSEPGVVEKIVEVPVEKIVEVPVEKIVEVPVEIDIEAMRTAIRSEVVGEVKELASLRKKGSRRTESENARMEALVALFQPQE